MAVHRRLDSRRSSGIVARAIAQGRGSDGGGVPDEAGSTIAGGAPGRRDRFDRHHVPETELEPIHPGSRLPGRIVALYDGRGRNETPLWLPEQRALVFADALTAPGGELRVWATPWHQERALPALRALLELPFEHVIVSHGEPVHTRIAYERALKLDPWSG